MNRSRGGGKDGGRFELSEGQEADEVEATEAAGYKDWPKLLVAAADVRPAAGTDHVWKPFIPDCPVLDLAHPGRQYECPIIHVLQHLEQQPAGGKAFPSVRWDRW